MIEVEVHGMVVDKKSGNPVLLLRVPDDEGLLPIWIGPAEANAIAMVLGHRRFERPLTHDLLHHVIEGLGATVSRVVITSLKENTFFAKIFLTRDHEIITIDARPSDSVALALRARSPIFLSAELLASQQGSLLHLESEEEDQQAKDSIDSLLRDVQRSVPSAGTEQEGEEDEEDEEDEADEENEENEENEEDDEDEENGDSLREAEENGEEDDGGQDEEEDDP